MVAKSASKLAVAMKKTPFFGFKATQGNPNSLLIASSSFHTNCRYGFDQIKNLDDAVYLFSQMLRMEPKPFARDYNKLLNIVVKMKHHSQPIMMFKKMSLLGCPVNEYTMNIVINCYCHLKEVDLGFAVMASFFKCGYTPDIVSITCLIKGLFFEERMVQAAHLFHQMLRMEAKPSVLDCNKLLNIVVKMKHYSQAIIMFKKISILGCPINEYTRSIVINCYCKLKQVDSGFAVLATFLKRGYSPDTVSVNCLIKGLFLEERVVEAVQLIMKVDRDKLCEVDEFTTFVVLDGLCKAGKVVNALELLVSLEKGKFKLDIYGFTTVIDGLCKTHRVDDAITLLSEMIERGFLPTVVTYNAIIKGLCYCSRLDEANKLLKRMVDDKVYPDVRTLNTLLSCYCKEGMIKEAEDVVRIMKQFHVQPDVVTYNALIDGYCLQGQIDIAMKGLNLMVKNRLKPDIVSYGTIINGYCKRKELDRAWKMFKELTIKGFKPGVYVYSTMIKGLFSVGRCSDALELYNEMKIVGLIDDSYTYGIVLDGLLNNGKFEEATLFYHEVDSKGLAVHVSFYNIFIHGLCKNKKLDSARSILNNLSLKGIFPNVKTYTVMIQGLCQEGLFEEAEEMLKKMEQSGSSPNNVTYTTIIKGCLKRHGSVGSMKLLKQIAKKDAALDPSYLLKLYAV